MKRYDKPIELIIEKSPTEFGPKSFTDIQKVLKEAGIPVESIKESPPVEDEMMKAVPRKKEIYAKGKIYVNTGISDIELNPWDLAHASVKPFSKQAVYAEPDAWNEYVTAQKVDQKFEDLEAKSFAADAKGNNYDPDWHPHQNIVWHLDDNHSQLITARNAVANENYPVRIGHLDTGYSNHPVIQARTKQNPLQRNFIDGEPAERAFDIQSEGFLKQPGHGTGTLGILAGDKVALPTDTGIFNDFLGGAFFADIVCCRISKSVILFKTSAFAEALKYLTQLTLNGTTIHVVSMSMGGTPSKSWADAVNDAYMAGITMVTAAGNNFNGLPTRHVVYPARFDRVIAACGVTFDYAPYWTKVIGEMQGNYGPSRHMDNALAAFTPNTTWASVGSGEINFSGAGTSSATPQNAAAAAIYYRKNHHLLDALKPWQRVEAVRNALYQSALGKIKNRI